MSSRVFVVSSNNGVESAFSAFVRFFIPNTIVKCSSVKKLREINSLDFEKSDDDIVVCLGDFWSDEYKASLSKSHIFYSIDYPFTKFIDSELFKSEHVNDHGLETNEKLISMLDDRIGNKKTLETQSLLTGIKNVFNDTYTEPEEKYYKLFAGEIRLSEVISIGEKIMSNDLMTCKDRCIYQSRCGTFKDGTRYSTAEGPELVNLTHDALISKYPDSQVTIVTKLIINDNEDRLHHSMRSYDENINVKTILQAKLGKDKDGNEIAGGTSTSAAGSQVIDLKIDY